MNPKNSPLKQDPLRVSQIYKLMILASSWSVIPLETGIHVGYLAPEWIPTSVVMTWTYAKGRFAPFKGPVLRICFNAGVKLTLFFQGQLMDIPQGPTDGGIVESLDAITHRRQ